MKTMFWDNVLESIIIQRSSQEPKGKVGGGEEINRLRYEKQVTGQI